MPRNAASDNGTPINKSEAVRGFMAAHPQASTREVVAALAGKGVKVTPALVYMIKSKARHAKKRARRDRAVASSRGMAAADPVALIRSVRELGERVGGIQNLKRLVDLLAE
jgi:hypothetical protein